jgi:hypothetical protein
MNAEKFFTEMYYDIWQGHNVERFSKYYSENFS